MVQYSGSAGDNALITSTRLSTFAVTIAAGALFWLLNMPLPLLLGPMLACLLAALIGVRMQDAGTLGTFMRTFLGVAVGSSITLATLGHLPDFAASLLFMPLFIALIGAVGYPQFCFVFGFNHLTAWYAAMPGGLQDKRSLAKRSEETQGHCRCFTPRGGDHYRRSIGYGCLLGVALSQPPGLRAAEIDMTEIVPMVVAGIAGWQLAERVGLFGAQILGTMILTAALSLTGVITPPAEII